MKLIDTNVLLNAVNTAALQHDVALRWMAGALGDVTPVGVPWQVSVSFLRITTARNIMPAPLTMERALSQLSAWSRSPAWQAVDPGPQHLALLGRLLRGARGSGNLVNDAHLAALAIEHGATLVSFDRDFQRFAGLQFELLQ